MIIRIVNTIDAILLFTTPFAFWRRIIIIVRIIQTIDAICLYKIDAFCVLETSHYTSDYLCSSFIQGIYILEKRHYDCKNY